MQNFRLNERSWSIWQRNRVMLVALASTSSSIGVGGTWMTMLVSLSPTPMSIPAWAAFTRTRLRVLWLIFLVFPLLQLSPLIDRRWFASFIIARFFTPRKRPPRPLLLLSYVGFTKESNIKKHDIHILASSKKLMNGVPIQGIKLSPPRRGGLITGFCFSSRLDGCNRVKEERIKKECSLFERKY